MFHDGCSDITLTTSICKPQIKPGFVEKHDMTPVTQSSCVVVLSPSVTLTLVIQSHDHAFEWTSCLQSSSTKSVRTVELDSRIPVAVRNSLSISGAVTNLFLRATVHISRSCLTIVFLSRTLPLLIVTLPVWRCNVTRREITLFDFPKNRAT